jgi:hypothetical protein
MVVRGGFTHDPANDRAVVLSPPRPRAQVGGLGRFVDFQIGIVPADGTRAAKWSKRGLRYVAVFEQLSGESRFTLCLYVGCCDQNTMARREINSR